MHYAGAHMISDAQAHYARAVPEGGHRPEVRVLKVIDGDIKQQKRVGADTATQEVGRYL
jgi:hypothetical protein